MKVTDAVSGDVRSLLVVRLMTIQSSWNRSVKEAFRLGVLPVVVLFVGSIGARRVLANFEVHDAHVNGGVKSIFQKENEYGIDGKEDQ